MFLVDANIFLEILLGQDKKEICKRFLDDNAGNLNIIDFSLHSMDVILFRYNREDVFQKFIQDVLPQVQLLPLPIYLYGEVISTRASQKLDFDNAYQYRTAKYYGLKMVTMDRDFERTKDQEILYL